MKIKCWDAATALAEDFQRTWDLAETVDQSHIDQMKMNWSKKSEDKETSAKDRRARSVSRSASRSLSLEFEEAKEA